MCGFYANNEKIKVGDRALLNQNEIEILKAEHIKSDKTMNIEYLHLKDASKGNLHFPYKTVTDIELLKRMEA
jgi:hypothetical protein